MAGRNSRRLRQTVVDGEPIDSDEARKDPITVDHRRDYDEDYEDYDEEYDERRALRNPLRGRKGHTIAYTLIGVVAFLVAWFFAYLVIPAVWSRTYGFWAIFWFITLVALFLAALWVIFKMIRLHRTNNS